MAELIKHECGIALVRLRKPLGYYHEQHADALWGLRKLYLLMGKQHNRGQDAAGLAALKLNVNPGVPYLAVDKALEPSPPWQALFKQVLDRLAQLRAEHPGLERQPDALMEHYPYAAEIYLGHLRYATHGKLNPAHAHPVVRPSNWRTKTLALAGNFNLTNVGQLFDKLVELGQHPQYYADTVTMLERTGHFLDRAVQALFDAYKEQGLENHTITERIAQELDVAAVLRRSAKSWDGGYTVGGLLGHGDAFIMRDPNGIRPAFYLVTDEVIAAASERPALATAFQVGIHQVQELPPGQALIIKHDGRWAVESFAEAQPRTSCSFERIYFSRGSDVDVYRERQALGRMLAPGVLHSINHDLDNTVFSFIPNTAHTAFMGLLKELEDYQNSQKGLQIAALAPPLDPTAVQRILAQRVRVEQVIHKDTNLRTFITSDGARDEMASHVYDITYGAIKPHTDTLVVLDDSIVRGTTLRQSILRNLARLQPRCILVVSSAPQIRYPDCYGIDMSQIGRFVAFQAAVSLLKKHGMEARLQQVYEACLRLEAENRLEERNCVQDVYQPYSEADISDEIAQLLTTPDLGCEVKVYYQPVANMPLAIPGHLGLWYFTGQYPTPGGNAVVNRAFMNYYEGNDALRAYEQRPGARRAQKSPASAAGLL